MERKAEYEVNFQRIYPANDTDRDEEKLLPYRRAYIDTPRITPLLEILPDADAFSFQERTYFIGGTFTALTDLEEELGPEKTLVLRREWAFGRVVTRSGKVRWLRHCTNERFLNLGEDGKLILPLDYQERGIVRTAHNHFLFGQLTIEQAIETVAICQHNWKHDSNIGLADMWECEKCSLGYQIEEYDYRQRQEIHQAFRVAWPDEARKVGRKFPALICSGIWNDPLGYAQGGYATPAVPGIMGG